MDAIALTKALEPLSRTFKVFQRVYPNQPLHRFAIFLHVAETPGVTMRQLGHWLSLDGSSVSRGLAELGDGRTHPRTKQHTPGLGLVTLVPDPDEPRRFMAYLTGKGHSLIKEIETAMG